MRQIFIEIKSFTKKTPFTNVICERVKLKKCLYLMKNTIYINVYIFFLRQLLKPSLYVNNDFSKCI